jgi:CheY-like chemotaxis protein
MLEEQLRQSQKMEAVGQLTGGIAHDFNNLLGVVVGNLDTVLEKLGEQSEQGQLINRALNSAIHGAELTHRLLAFSRQQSLEPKAFAINDLLPDLSALLKRTLGEAIAMRVEAGSDLWPAFADLSQLRDAIINLAINARDAMPDGGTLTIETANIHLDEAYARANPGVTPGDYAMLAVTDTGVGMSADIVERAVEPFFTTKSVGKGTGLGLSMVYGFARQSGGHVKIHSEVGHGTTVKLYLPRAKVAAAAGQPLYEAASQLPGGTETILLAEDNAELRHTAVYQLEKLGYRVLAAQNGEAALAVLRGAEPIDMLFSDIVMTGKLTGTDLVSEARKLRPNIRVLLTTGYAEKVASSGGQGAWQLLRKPYRKRDLAIKVRSVLDQD